MYELKLVYQPVRIDSWRKIPSIPCDQSSLWPQTGNLVVLRSLTFQFVVAEQTVAINHARSEPFISLCRAARWNQNIRDTIHSQFSRAKGMRWKRKLWGGFKVRAFQNSAKPPKKMNARFIKYLETFLVTSASHLLPVRHYQMYHFIWYNCVYGNLNWGKHKVKHKNVHQDTLAETLTSVLTSAVAACVAWSRRGGKTHPWNAFFRPFRNWIKE